MIAIYLILALLSSRTLEGSAYLVGPPLMMMARTRTNGAAVPKAVVSSKNQDVQDENTERIPDKTQVSGRRSFLIGKKGLVSVVAAAAATSFLAEDSAVAYDKSYPIELQAVDVGADKSSRERRMSRILEQQEKEKTLALQFKPLKAAVWGSALWFLSGSRSNPIATPLANAFYDPEKEEWLRDRNEGLFADLPIPLYIALAVIFFALGAVTDNVLTLVFEPSFSLPLAVVAMLNGLYFELGRIASGDKGSTREEADRASLLETEFQEFAEARLQPGGSCHRQEITQAFRRYFAKYRQAESQDSEEEGLSDLQVERLIRAWCKERGILMTSSGFFKGIKINTDADVFVQR